MCRCLFLVLLPILSGCASVPPPITKVQQSGYRAQPYAGVQQ